LTISSSLDAEPKVVWAVPVLRLPVKRAVAAGVWEEMGELAELKAALLLALVVVVAYYPDQMVAKEGIQSVDWQAVVVVVVVFLGKGERAPQEISSARLLGLEAEAEVHHQIHLAATGPSAQQYQAVEVAARS
jgi:hypothetical protein